jgi:hypothetical protein
MKSKRKALPPARPRAGRRPGEFCEEAGFGRSTLYVVPLEFWPEYVKLGDRIIITEEPADWLRRMKALGGVPTIRRPKATETAEQPA